MKKMCDVCGEHEAVQIACSAYGATSRMLPLWGKTEEEFIRDVETMIEKEEYLCL